MSTDLIAIGVAWICVIAVAVYARSLQKTQDAKWRAAITELADKKVNRRFLA